MNIGIIGTGNMARGIGRILLRRGHAVVFGSRTPAEHAALAKEVGCGARVESIDEAAELGEIVFLAIPWNASREIATTIADRPAKVLVDVTNPVADDFMTLLVGHTTSGAEEIAANAGSTPVVKAFNTIFAQVLQSGEPKFDGRKVTVFYAGDDLHAKQKMARLGREMGFDPVDAGPLQNARYLEPMAELNIQLGYGLGMGTDIALTQLRR